MALNVQVEILSQVLLQNPSLVSLQSSKTRLESKGGARLCSYNLAWMGASPFIKALKCDDQMQLHKSPSQGWCLPTARKLSLGITGIQCNPTNVV